MATNTYSEYVKLIVFLQQEWLHERASMLRETYRPKLSFTSNEYSLGRVGINQGSATKGPTSVEKF